MNDELKQKCQELNRMLKTKDFIQEYQNIEKSLQVAEFIELENRIKKLQKKLVNQSYQGNEVDALKIELLELHEKYFDHPLVNNYAYLKEEINQLFQYVIHYINGGIR